MHYTSSPSPPASPPTSDSECEIVTRSNLFPITSNACLDSIPPHPHPFAASAKANRAPPEYEKKTITPPTTPPDPEITLCPSREQMKDSEVEPGSRVQHSLSLPDEEQKRWDFAISSAVDKAETTIDLSNAGLTYIPASIIDLKNIVVLARNERSSPTTTRKFTRSVTTPATLSSSHIRPFLPTYSTNRLEFKTTGQLFENLRKPVTVRNGCELELYLMRNAIRMLPRELFALDCLVVLSLRQNKLTSLPPAICRLTRLRELNIANNRLSHLPAEIQHLRLRLLHLYPNPFTAPPLPPEGKKVDNTWPGRTLGPLRRDPSAPPLFEFALRCLLSPATPTRSKSCLEDSMSLAEIDALVLPEHCKRIIRASTGHARARLTEEGAPMNAELDMSMNVCPCPLHHSSVRTGISSKKSVRFLPNEHHCKSGLFDHNAPVFRVPVEERMEWVGTVAGVQVAESPNAWVPLLWRGCGPGCLDFLEDNKTSDDCKSTFATCDGEDEFQFSDDE